METARLEAKGYAPRPWLVETILIYMLLGGEEILVELRLKMETQSSRKRRGDLNLSAGDQLALLLQRFF